MTTRYTFDAPWALSLRLMTLFGLAVLLGVAAIGLVTGPRHLQIWTLSMVALPVLIVVVSVFFVILGYEVDGRQLCVKRLGWRSVIELEGLESVEADADAMKGSLRLLGNGGLFCFAGLFRNRKLGRYRAFATDPSLSVVLRFPDRIVVVTPDRPKKFIQAVSRS